MSWQKLWSVIFLLVLEMTAYAQSLPKELEHATVLEPEELGGCFGSGSKSSLSAAFQSVVRDFKESERLNLLHHPNAVVRAYAAQYFGKHLPAHAQELSALLADQKSVKIEDLVAGGRFFIDEHVATRLCQYVEDLKVRSILRQAATRPGLRLKIRRMVYSCSVAAERAANDNEETRRKLSNALDLKTK